MRKCFEVFGVVAGLVADDDGVLFVSLTTLTLAAFLLFFSLESFLTLVSGEALQLLPDEVFLCTLQFVQLI
jgi:hypothetical protein